MCGLQVSTATQTTALLAKKEIDLSRIDEIGFTDLSCGAGHGAEGNSAVDWVEVYGRAGKR